MPASPIHIDKTLLGLLRADYPVPEGIQAKDLLGRARLRLGVKQGYSYGPYLDEAIGRLPDLIKMVHGRHLDMILVMDEEAES